MSHVASYRKVKYDCSYLRRPLKTITFFKQHQNHFAHGEKLSFRFYKDHEVRAIWNEEENKWFFSVVDIVAAITGSPRPRVYWGTVKNRQKAEHAQLYSKCIQLKLTSADGKKYATDCFAQDDIEAVVKTLPARNTADFKRDLSFLNFAFSILLVIFAG